MKNILLATILLFPVCANADAFLGVCTGSLRLTEHTYGNTSPTKKVKLVTKRDTISGQLLMQEQFDHLNNMVQSDSTGLSFAGRFPVGVLGADINVQLSNGKKSNKTFKGAQPVLTYDAKITVQLHFQDYSYGGYTHSGKVYCFSSKNDASYEGSDTAFLEAKTKCVKFSGPTALWWSLFDWDIAKGLSVTAQSCDGKTKRNVIKFQRFSSDEFSFSRVARFSLNGRFRLIVQSTGKWRIERDFLY